MQLYDERTGNEAENPVFPLPAHWQDHRTLQQFYSSADVVVKNWRLPIPPLLSWISLVTLSAPSWYSMMSKKRANWQGNSPIKASHDALTSLRNRNSFEKHLQQALGNTLWTAANMPYAYVDLDQFKVVNDTCGHVAGDELLRQLSQLIKQELRDSDIIARLVAMNSDPVAVLRYGSCQRCRRKTAQGNSFTPFSWQGHQFEIGASIGLVPVTSESGSLGEIMSLADMACYAAKDKGRNRIHVWQPDDNELRRRHGEMQWVPRIKRALDEDRFQLYYQTIASTDKNSPAHSHFEIWCA